MKKKVFKKIYDWTTHIYLLVTALLFFIIWVSKMIFFTFYSDVNALKGSVELLCFAFGFGVLYLLIVFFISDEYEEV